MTSFGRSDLPVVGLRLFCTLSGIGLLTWAERIQDNDTKENSKSSIGRSHIQRIPFNCGYVG